MASNEVNEARKTKFSKFGLDLAMLPCKITYIVWGGVVGTYSPYLNVFFVSIGLSPSQAGFMTGIRLIASSIANPLWGFLADYSGRRKLIIFLMCLGSILFVFPLPWIVRGIQQHSATNTTCSNHTARVSFNVNANCGKQDNTVLFYVLVAILSAGAAFIVPLPGYVDTIAMSVVKTKNTGATYGGQRIFGSVGYSIFNSLAALASDHYHVSGMSQYTPVFFFFLTSIVCIFPLVCYNIGQAKFKVKSASDNERISQGAVMRKKALRLLKSFDVIVFLITVVISGCAMATYMYFTLLLIKDIMPTTKAKMSLVLVVGSLSNMVMFPFTSIVIKLLRGPTQGIIVALSTYFIRYMIMSYTSVFIIMVSVQALQGVCFALAWSSMMEHVHKIVPNEVKLTVFMLLSGIHFGICGLIVNIAGGKLYEEYGGRALFRGVGVICGAWVIFMIIYHTIKHMKKKRQDDISDIAVVENTNPRSGIERNNDVGTDNIAIEMNEA